MKAFDLRHIVAEQQNLLVHVQPLERLESAMFKDVKLSARGTPNGTTSDPSLVVSSSLDLVSRSKSNKGPAGTSENALVNYQDDISLPRKKSEGIYTEDIIATSSIVISAELQLRDILSDQLQSIEAQKERERQERLMAQEASMTKYLVTFQHNEDGTPIFEAVETPLNKADKFIPAAYVKLISANEQVIYR